MRIKPGFELRTICGENIIISLGKENIDFTKVITLNESAAIIWKALVGREFTIKDAVDVILQEYEATEEQVTPDIKKLLKSWVEVGIANE